MSDGAWGRKVFVWISVAGLLVLGALFLMNRMKPKRLEAVPPIGSDRVAEARLRCGVRLRAVFEKAGIA